MKQLIKLIYDILPFMLYTLEIYISIRTVYIYKKKAKIDIIKEITVPLFVIYLIILFYIISKPTYTYNIINIKPFKEILRYNITSRLFIKNVVGNILLFIPYSMFLSYYLKINKIYILLIMSFIFSLSIELIQIKLGRVFDIDDIILNIISSIIGYFIYKLINIKVT